MARIVASSATGLIRPCLIKKIANCLNFRILWCVPVLRADKNAHSAIIAAIGM